MSSDTDGDAWDAMADAQAPAQVASAEGLFTPGPEHDAAVTRALYERAVGGVSWSEKLDRFGTVVRLEAREPPDVAAAKLWLQARAPEQWAEKRTAEFRVIVARLGQGSEREAAGLTFDAEAEVAGAEVVRAIAVTSITEQDVDA